ncbi:uncharacterized protein LOC119091336 [Pollicipes pollicipes]|uniref:uncharacterized protein LOC119091336 n=1 Tax=Pollicipes pollicipes TaxID=41117 RepID=UPI0018854549|nr:uncharacterized protein LOC119091336 [Pollicipes pollicipes]XP_037069959.1 uncharacterized protein LOC119091336 [Pollicipes pollicipes]
MRESAVRRSRWQRQATALARRRALAQQSPEPARAVPTEHASGPAAAALDRATHQPTTSVTNRMSDSTDSPHYGPCVRPSAGGTTGTRLSRAPDHENEPVHSDSDSYASTSSEPERATLPGCAPLPTDDSGAAADSESSETERSSCRAWFCRRPDCRRLNPPRCLYCSCCRTGRVRAGSDPAEGRCDPPAEPREAARPAGSCCLMCRRRPVGAAAILHGRSACQSACHRCARRLWKLGRPCPGCGQHIEKIVTLWYA